MHIPWMKFYPSDWRSDPALHVCSIAARGLWMEMLCVMHEASPRGSLLINGRQVTERQLAALAGIADNEARRLLSELEEAGVLSRDADGTIYSRRIRRDDEKAENDRANGRKGGNPTLATRVNRGVKGGVNPPVNGEDKAQKPDTICQTPHSPPRGCGPEEKALRDEVTKAFQDIGSKSPDTSRVGIWLAKGFSAAIILAVVKECLAKNRNIRSLSYFDDAIAEAHENRPAPDRRPEAPPDPAQVRRGQKSKALRFFRNDWPDNWTGKPGEPDCDIPDEVLIEAARECGKDWPPRSVRASAAEIPLPPEALGAGRPARRAAECRA